MATEAKKGGLTRARDRAYASLYNLINAGAERNGLRHTRQELLSNASDVTLEIGAGTGVNIPLYPSAVTELVLTEPDPYMVARLRRRVAKEGRAAEVVVAPGNRLPFAGQRFDTVVMTMVLCTAPAPAQVLEEVKRVLKPGGRLIFMEHIKSDSPRLAQWQDRLAGPWRAVMGGCNCNRETLETFRQSPLKLVQVEHIEMPTLVPIVAPMITGIALRK